MLCLCEDVFQESLGVFYVCNIRICRVFIEVS